MFEEPNKETLNHFFEKIGDYEYKSRPATKKEIEDMREDAKKGEWMALGRSCWECNKAHIRLIDMENMNCSLCGKMYHKGYDIVDYIGSELEKHTHLNNQEKVK